MRIPTPPVSPSLPNRRKLLSYFLSVDDDDKIEGSKEEDDGEDADDEHVTQCNGGAASAYIPPLPPPVRCGCHEQYEMELNSVFSVHRIAIGVRPSSRCSLRLFVKGEGRRTDQVFSSAPPLRPSASAVLPARRRLFKFESRTSSSTRMRAQPRQAL